jgi:hypothetical protein
VDLKTALTVAIFFVAIGCLTAIASSQIGIPEKEAAVAVAAREYLVENLGKELVSKGDEILPKLVLCLDFRNSLNIDLVSKNLSDTIIKPVPVTACSSKTIEGNFGMFTAITHYSGPEGDEAAHLAVVRVSCQTTKSCEVDIDSRGSGVRYWVERSGQTWKVTDSRLRWIV